MEGRGKRLAEFAARKPQRNQIRFDRGFAAIKTP